MGSPSPDSRMCCESDFNRFLILFLRRNLKIERAPGNGKCNCFLARENGLCHLQAEGAVL